MARFYSFNPEVDRLEVDQFGFIDLRSAFEKGIIPSNVGFTDESFNGVAAPGLLIPHAQDVFESLRQSNYVQSVLKDAASKEREKLAKEVAEKTIVSAPTE